MFLNKPTKNSSSLMEEAVQWTDQATPALGRARERVSSLMHCGLDGARETSHQLRVKAEHASENTVNYIRHKPVKSVLVAAATGAVLMALISLLNQTRSR